MSSAQTEYKAMSLGEISKIKDGIKETLGPVEVGEMRRKPVTKEKPRECDVLEAKEVGGTIIS